MALVSVDHNTSLLCALVCLFARRWKREKLPRKTYKMYD